MCDLVKIAISYVKELKRSVNNSNKYLNINSVNSQLKRSMNVNNNSTNQIPSSISCSSISSDISNISSMKRLSTCSNTEDLFKNVAKNNLKKKRNWFTPMSIIRSFSINLSRTSSNQSQANSASKTDSSSNQENKENNIPEVKEKNQELIIKKNEILIPTKIVESIEIVNKAEENVVQSVNWTKINFEKLLVNGKQCINRLNTSATQLPLLIKKDSFKCLRFSLSIFLFTFSLIFFLITLLQEEDFYENSFKTLCKYIQLKKPALKELK